MKKAIRILLPIFLAGLGLAACFILVSSPGHNARASILSMPQAEMIVTTLEDELNEDGDCSLREAIAAANTNAEVDACGSGEVLTDTITFGVAGTIVVNGQLEVAAGGPLLIDGGNNISINGGDIVRILNVQNEADLLLENLTILNGNANEGGAIYNLSTLKIAHCTISANHADYYGGGIYNYGNLEITNSTFSNNNAVNNGGGIYNESILVITNSTLVTNTAGDWGGGIFNSFGTLTVINSTLSGNSTEGGGGGIANWYSTLTLSNSTLSGNSAMTEGGAIFQAGGAEATISGSIIAHSLSGGNCAWAPINDGGYNIEDSDTCGFDPENGSMPNTNPLLGPLQDNGGPTWTYALLPGSPAIDAGDDAQCPPTDQRGVTRPRDGDGDGLAICDIGSFEVGGPPVPPELITLTGSSEGYVGPVTYFTATVEPVSATLPLTYVWLASDHPPITHTTGLSDTQGWAWELPGTYAITVTASNPAGAVTGMHQISLSDVPISGLSASNDSPTALGELTLFTAVITSGTNVAFEWTFGDGSTASGDVVSHTYTLPDLYTATVTATNSANQLTATTQVSVYEPTQSIYLPLVRKAGSQGQLQAFSWLEKEHYIGQINTMITWRWKQ